MVLGLVTESMVHPVNQLRRSARFDAQTGPASSSSAILAADALMDVLAGFRRRSGQRGENPGQAVQLGVGHRAEVPLVRDAHPGHVLVHREVYQLHG
jgi:hypothetical protein